MIDQTYFINPPSMKKPQDSELSHRSLRGEGFVSILTELGSVSYSCLVIRGDPHHPHHHQSHHHHCHHRHRGGIPGVGPEDGGRYSCLPGNLSPANITVHVLKGLHYG